MPKTRGHPAGKTRSPFLPADWQQRASKTMMAGILSDAYDAYTAPQRAYRGLLDPMSDEAVKNMADLAGMVTLGSGAVPAQANSLRMGVKLRGGGVSDPTQTGWTFKDVTGQPKLSKSENRRYSEAAMAPRVETVPIRKLNATQGRVNPDFATTETSSGVLPKVIKKDGQLYVMDGHHRLTKVAEDGGQNARVELFDFDSADAPDMPLLDFDPVKNKALKDEIDQLYEELFNAGFAT